MRVLVTGAYGLIGSAVLARLHRDGHELVGAGRSIEEAARRAPFARWLAADFNRLTTPGDWRPLLSGIDAVVNCVGVLESSAGDDVGRTHVDGTVALFEACAAGGIRRIVHVSAIGAAADGRTDFARTKARADAHLATLDLDWIVLRPALVLAPAVYGGTAMLRGLAAFPAFTPAIAGADRVQVIGIDDLADTVAFCLRPGAPRQVIWELAHPRIHSLGEIVAALRQWLGFVPRPVVTLPRWSLAPIAFFAATAAMLGWRSPARPTALLQIDMGVVGDPSAWSRATGIQPRGLAAILAERPASVQDRWFAQLYLLKPLAIAALALFWVMTGVVTLGPGRAAADAQLAASGFPPAAVAMTVVLGALFDIVLGLLVLVRRLARRVLWIMLAVTPIYLLIGSLLAPQLWLDPLGPLLKVVPILVLTVMTLAMMDER